MAKLGSPLKEPLYVTQTYHTQSNNTAVDFSAVAETPVYAVADGKVTYRSSELGSYCIQTLDNSDLKVYSVHTYKWVGANTWVKKGQIICYVAPSSVNGGHPTHLHLGLQVGRYLMDYMDRSLDIRAGFIWGSKENIAIRNAWFNGGSVFDWSKHKDLSYNTNTMLKIGDRVELTADTNLRVGSGVSFNIKTVVKKGAIGEIIGGPRTADGYEWWDIRFLNNQGWMANPSGTRLTKTTRGVTQTDGKIPTPPPTPTPPPESPVPVPTPTDPTIELKKRIDTLTKEIEELKTALGASEDKNDLLTGQIKDKDAEIKKLKAEVEELKESLKKSEDNFTTLSIKKNEIENERDSFELENSELKLELKKKNKTCIERILDWAIGGLAKIFKRDK